MGQYNQLKMLICEFYYCKVIRNISLMNAELVYYEKKTELKQYEIGDKVLILCHRILTSCM